MLAYLLIPQNVSFVLYKVICSVCRIQFGLQTSTTTTFIRIQIISMNHEKHSDSDKPICCRSCDQNRLHYTNFKLYNPFKMSSNVGNFPKISKMYRNYLDLS